METPEDLWVLEFDWYSFYSLFRFNPCAMFYGLVMGSFYKSRIVCSNSASLTVSNLLCFFYPTDFRCTVGSNLWSCLFLANTFLVTLGLSDKINYC